MLEKVISSSSSSERTNRVKVPLLSSTADLYTCSLILLRARSSVLDGSAMESQCLSVTQTSKFLTPTLVYMHAYAACCANNRHSIL